MYTSLLLTVLPVALALPASLPAPGSNLAPVIIPRDGTLIPGKYIVKLKSAPGDFEVSAASLLENDPTSVYQLGNFHGFAAEMSPETVEKLRSHPNVDSIHQDGIIKVQLKSTSSSTTTTSKKTSSSTTSKKTSSSTTTSSSTSTVKTSSSSSTKLTSSSSSSSSPSTKSSSSSSSSSSTTTKSSSSHTPSQPANSVVQTGADWGLARLSNKSPGSSTYTYDSSAGAGTCVYVIDSGIDIDHPDFEGRAIFLTNLSDEDDDDDLFGHGTHVAGTVGSKTYGVAKKTTIFSVKVLDSNGTGSYSAFLDAINFVANDAPSQNCPNGTVTNISAGGDKSDVINDAVNNLVSSGIFVAVAAGNEYTDASNTSPASANLVFAVGATDSLDNMAPWSNYGPVVDIFAPGVDITSTWPDDNYAIMSGTSMATPHIAGLAAYMLALEGKKSPLALESRLKDLALKGKIKGLKAGTDNSLAFNNNPTAK